MPHATSVKAVARATVQVKATGVDDAGQPVGYFDATVAVYDNVDFQNDVLEKGAFDASLKAWNDSGDPIPVIWSHMWDDPFAHVGYVDPKNVTSEADGLHVHDAVLDLNNPMGAQVYELMKGRRVREFSFGYDPTDFKMEGDVRHLNAVDLWELGPTLKGANPATVLEGVKAAVAQDVQGSAETDGVHDESGDDETPVLDVPDAIPDDVTDGIREVLKAYEPDAVIAALTALVDAVRADADTHEDESKALKVGRVLSGKNEQDLRDARDLIGKVLASVVNEDQADKDKRARNGSAASREDPKPKSLGLLSYDITLLELGGLE